MLEGAPDKLSGPFSQVEPTGFAQGHFSVICDRANADLRLNVMMTALPAMSDDGQLCSGCCRWPPVYELTVWSTLLPFVGAGGSAVTDSYQGTADVAKFRRNLRRICDTLRR